MKVITKDRCSLWYSPDNIPVLEVAPGEEFQLETASVLTDITKFPNVIMPVTGPVFIKGAHPGSVLKVDIIETSLPAGEGVVMTLPPAGIFSDRILQPKYKVIPYDGAYCYFNESTRVPLHPMVGKIGTTFADRDIKCNAPGPHGGNMDIRDITKGTTVYLPVFVEGALFAAGDVHAAQGDGEIQSGLETEALLTLRCDVTAGIELTHPLLVNEEFVMTVAEGESLEEAYRIALDDMVKLVMDGLGLSFLDATFLASVATNIKINQVASALVGARVAIPKTVLPLSSISL